MLATASLRIATVTLATGAAGVAVSGTGFLVYEGGRFVVRRTWPGIIKTIRIANQVAQVGGRSALLAGAVTTRIAVTAISSAASAAGSVHSNTSAIVVAAREEARIKSCSSDPNL
jgi:transketolase C-terminal domain/subunit